MAHSIKIGSSFTVWLGLASAVGAAAFTPVGVAAQNPPSVTIKIANDADRRLKLCAYKESDLVKKVAEKCFTLAVDEAATWQRKIGGKGGDVLRFRVFEPRLFDKLVCEETLPVSDARVTVAISLKRGTPCMYTQRSGSGPVITIPPAPAPAPAPSPTPTPAPAPTGGYQAGDAVLVGVRSNPQDRQQRYYPATITGRDDDGRYTFTQWNGRSGRLTEQFIHPDTVGKGSTILARPRNGGAYQSARVDKRFGNLLLVQFNDGTETFADMSGVKQDSEDLSPEPLPRSDQGPSWILRVCNKGAQGLKVATALEPVPGDKYSRGFTDVGAGACEDTPIGLPTDDDVYGATGTVYAYAERWLNYGVRAPVIEKPAKGRSYCVGIEETWSFFHTNRAGADVPSQYCNGAGQRLAPMTPLALPEGGGIVQWTLLD